MVHMKDQLARWGPVRESWMFPFERYFGHMVSTINNRNHFVANMMQQEAARLYLGMAMALLQHWKRWAE
eukprot:140896-Pyramimonas_sp.AAC.1